jgi:hypothetical protein
MNTYSGFNYKQNSLNVNSFSDMMQQTLANFDDSKKNNLTQAERLVSSVNAVTELLRANTLLRDNLEKAEFNYEEKDSENYQLQIENVRMREAIEILEGLLE